MSNQAANALQAQWAPILRASDNETLVSHWGVYYNFVNLAGATAYYAGLLHIADAELQRRGLDTSQLHVTEDAVVTYKGRAIDYDNDFNNATDEAAGGGAAGGRRRKRRRSRKRRRHSSRRSRRRR